MADQIPPQPAMPPPAPAAQASQTTAPQQVTPQQAATPQAAPQTAGQVEDDEKFFAALGYFAFLFVVPLIVKPKSAYCKFHARQSMVLFLMTIIVLVVLASVPMVGSLLTLALFAVYVLAIYKAYKGDLWSIPVISGFAGKMNVEALYGKAGLAVSGISGLKEKAEGMAAKAGEAVKDMGKQENLPPAQTPSVPPDATPPAA